MQRLEAQIDYLVRLNETYPIEKLSNKEVEELVRKLGIKGRVDLYEVKKKLVTLVNCFQ